MRLYGKNLKNSLRNNYNLNPLPDNWREYGGLDHEEIVNKIAADASWKAAEEFFNPIQVGMVEEMKNITATEIRQREAAFNQQYYNNICFPPCVSPYAKDNNYSFGNCKPASTQDYTMQSHDCLAWSNPVIKEEGNNPMFTTTSPKNAAASISEITINATPQPSDAMTQRKYLLGELRSMTDRWEDPTLARLKKMFNIDAPILPQTSAELIAAFKDGKYKIDQKKVDKQTEYFAAAYGEERDDLWEMDIGDRYYGIVFTDLPVADVKGYDLAKDEYRKFLKTIERKINILSPEAGLELLATLDAWMPSNAPALVTVH